MIKYRKIIACLTAVFALAAVQTSFAKSINMYDQPQTTAKVVGTIDSDSSMVPIFTSKAGDWMKIGNPKNGDVGWVKVSDFNSKSGSGFSFSQQTISTPDGPKTTIQFGAPQEMTPDQVKEMQKRQADLQNSIQKMVNDVYKDLNRVYTDPSLYPGAKPFFIPVVIVPQPAAAPVAATPPAAPPAPPKPAAGQ